jgi:hypothetical protein
MFQLALHSQLFPRKVPLDEIAVPLLLFNFLATIFQIHCMHI